MSFKSNHLIILNGPPASGKSTLAKTYAEHRPMTLVLDIDEIRARISYWQDHVHEAGLQARAMAVVMARVHLGNGYDVIVPQAYGVISFLEQWEALAQECGAAYFEVMLTLPKSEVLKRYAARDGADFDAAEIEELADKIARVQVIRPRRAIDQLGKTSGESYAGLIKMLGF